MKTIIVVLILGILLEVECRCVCNCSLEWKPICAKDRRSGDQDTFPNECILNCYNCTHDKSYTIQSNNECEKSKLKQGKRDLTEHEHEDWN